MKLIIDIHELDKIYKIAGQRLNPNSYIVCRDIRGNVTFIPFKTSRHSHVIVVAVSNEKDYDKVAEWARNKGFEILENCIAMPTEG